MNKILLVLSILILVSCKGNSISKMSLASGGPDEFAVMSRSPLAIPANFDLVAPGSPRKANISDITQNNTKTLSPGEQAISTSINSNMSLKLSHRFDNDTPWGQDKNNLSKDSTKNPMAHQETRTYNSQSINALLKQNTDYDNKCVDRTTLKTTACQKIIAQAEVPLE